MNTKTLYANIVGMHCASCVQRVETELQRTPGILSSSVNLMLNRAVVEVDGATYVSGTIESAIGRAGYTIDAVVEEHHRPSSDSNRGHNVQNVATLRTSLSISIPLTALIMLVSMSSMVWHISDVATASVVNISLFLLTLPVLWSGRRFAVAAWNGAKHGVASMDTLVTIGTGAAFFYSTVAVLQPSLLPGSDAHVGAYFDTTATIITLVLVGQFLEARAKGKAADALQRLMELRPRVTRVRRNGQDVEIAIDDVRINDAVIVLPGERIPIDGVIAEGHTSVDESMMTGESIPSERSVGNNVIGGTLNGTGSIVVIATAVGAATVLSHIISAVEHAQSSKAPIQRLADRISGVFVPVVLAIAVITFVVWMALWPDADAFAHGLTAAIAVLIIACPCALGLATPAAIVVGTGMAAERGVLFGSAQSVEMLNKANVVVLDKTGTVTMGTPTFQQAVYVSSAEDTDNTLLWSLVTSLEKRSEHPIARALSTPPLEFNGALQLLLVERSEAIVGKGTIGVVGGYNVRIGTEALMADALILIPDDLLSAANDMASNGITSVFVAVNGLLRATMGVADSLRQTSVTAIRELRNRGIDVVLLSGDRELVAKNIAEQAGIDVVIADVRPDEKAHHIQRLQDAGKFVVMVGDGINDAPALAQANVGVAMGGGTDAAKAAADVTLVRSDLTSLISAFDASAATMRTIRQNLFFAFAYNVIGIPIAAGVLYPITGLLLSPMIAAAAMALSSVTVISNALRLRSALS